MAYDLFISYRRLDAARVQPLADALRALGLNVWLDRSQIGDFDPITNRIREGLAESKALLAWYSADYPKSRPCQMELTAAFIAPQRETDPRRRVLVVNPESGAGHVQPVELADEQHLPAPAEPADREAYADLAGRIAEHLSALRGTLGAILPVDLPPQHGQNLVGASRFVGRLPDLWKVHSALHAGDSAIISGTYGPRLAQLSGLGGVGKSLLAEEYALRFGAAYPGGLFWLRALGNDPNRPRFTAEEQETLRTDQLGGLAVALGLEVKGLDPAEVEAALAARLHGADKPFLWVVDDLASGLDNAAVRRWLAPAPKGRTLITTRSRGYASVGTAVPVNVLPVDEAYALLTARRNPRGAEEEAAARGIAEDLGFHPLALAVTGGILEADAGLGGFVQFRADLARHDQDELELATELGDQLPNGHEKSVAATLLRSVRGLSPEGLDFLRLASWLAVAPIPARLVQEALAVADGLDDDHARRRARAAGPRGRRGPGRRAARGGGHPPPSSAGPGGAARPRAGRSGNRHTGRLGGPPRLRAR